MIKLSTSTRASAIFLNDFKKFSNFQKAAIFCLVKEDYRRLFSTIEKYILPQIQEGINLQTLGCILDQISFHRTEKPNELFEIIGTGEFVDKIQMIQIVKRFVKEMDNGFEGNKTTVNTTNVTFSAIAILERIEAVAEQPLSKEEKEFAFEKAKGELYFRSFSYEAALKCFEKAIKIKKDDAVNSLILSTKFIILGKETGQSLLSHHMTLQDRDDLRFDDWIAAGEEEEEAADF